MLCFSAPFEQPWAHAVQELQVEISDWHQIKRIRPTSHMRRTALPDLSVDKVHFELLICHLLHEAKQYVSIMKPNCIAEGLGVRAQTASCLDSAWNQIWVKSILDMLLTDSVLHASCSRLHFTESFLKSSLAISIAIAVCRMSWGTSSQQERATA